MSTPGSDFFLDLWTAGHMGERLAAEELQKKGVDGEQLTVLLRLAAEERPVTQSALAAAIGVPFSTMTHALGRLVERGEAERLPHPTDRRAQLVRITAAGRKRAKAAAPALTAALRRLELEGGAGEAVTALAAALSRALSQEITISS